MKNVAMKIAMMIIIATLIVSIFNMSVFGASDAFSINIFENGKAGDAEKMTRTALETVLAVTRVVATGIAIIMLSILGIKYIIASAGERAEIKKQAVVYVVGAVIMFAASGILGIIEGFSKNISA